MGMVNSSSVLGRTAVTGRLPGKVLGPCLARAFHSGQSLGCNKSKVLPNLESLCGDMGKYRGHQKEREETWKQMCRVKKCSLLRLASSHTEEWPWFW